MTPRKLSRTRCLVAALSELVRNPTLTLLETRRNKRTRDNRDREYASDTEDSVRDKKQENDGD